MTHEWSSRTDVTDGAGVLIHLGEVADEYENARSAVLSTADRLSAAETHLEMALRQYYEAITGKPPLHLKALGEKRFEAER